MREGNLYLPARSPPGQGMPRQCSCPRISGFAQVLEWLNWLGGHPTEGQGEAPRAETRGRADTRGRRRQGALGPHLCAAGCRREDGQEVPPGNVSRDERCPWALRRQAVSCCNFLGAKGHVCVQACVLVCACRGTWEEAMACWMCILE